MSEVESKAGCVDVDPTRRFGAAGVLLIHGGEHAGWSWSHMRVHLDCPSIAIDLPGRDGGSAVSNLSVRDYVDAAVRLVEESEWQQVIVVAHSLGGVTACGLAHTLPQKVRHLIFVASVIPEKGERFMDLAPGPLRPLFEWGYRRAVARHGVYKFPDVVARYLFCNDFDRAETRDLIGRLCAEPPGIVLERAEFSAPAGIPRTYIRPRHDHALNRRTQKRMIRLLGDVDVIDIDAGHNVMMSRPIEIATVANAIAGRCLSNCAPS